MQTELIKELNKVLKAFPQFWNGEELHRSMVSDAISHKQPDLIKALVANEKIKTVYGTDIDGVFIFDFDKLCSLLKYKEYWTNSFTKYRNKIGLTSSGKYISDSTDVVIDFPFKDCVLEGGMKKESKGKDEVYYNEIIARDEIDNLLSPKALIHISRYKKNSQEKDLKSIGENENLIIKGNNLVAISSLMKKFHGKIKVIYIDPPYNTGNDGFKYNDNFNRSTWLTFMKNRLEKAKDLLSNDGFIFIQCDDNESAYLKVLCDSIFGEENYRNSIYWHRTYAGKTVKSKLPWNTDTILLYSKTEDSLLEPYTAILSPSDIKSYNKDDADGRGKYNTVSLQKTSSPGPQTTYDYIDNKGKVWPCPEKGWRMKQEKLKALENDGRLYITEKTIREKYYLNERMTIGKQIDNFWHDIGNLNRVSDDAFIDGQKTEKLMQRIISLASKENDYVLDFHMGSGTTISAAHKMNRHFIGIEQMDYINEFTIPRLQRVLNGEQTGISQDVNWQGGGSFIYAELMELNACFVHEIQKAQSNEELEKLFAVMKTEAHLNYQVALENVLSAEYEMDGIPRKVAFSELELHEQKQLLIEILDKNQLYVNASDMDDSDLNISESDKAFTRSFYGME